MIKLEELVCKIFGHKWHASYVHHYDSGYSIYKQCLRCKEKRITETLCLQ